MSRISLKFESTLKATPEQVWSRITSLEGLTSEMLPLFRLTAPQGVKTLQGLIDRRNSNKPIKSWVLLFGFLPIDYTDLHLKSIESGRGFVEESNMGSMRYWRHERRIEAIGADQVKVIDELIFEPKFFASVSKALIKLFFTHRHNNLRKSF